MSESSRDLSNDDNSLPRARRLSWETHMTVPQTAENMAHIIKHASEFIKDPFSIFKRAILQSALSPEILRITQFIMIILSTIWNTIVLSLTLYAAFKALKVTFFIIERISWCIFGSIQKSRTNIGKVFSTKRENN